jgi:hypothetical protein
MLRATPVRMGTVVRVMFMSAVATRSTPLREADTVNATIPGIGPAVNVVDDPVDGSMDPSVLFSVQV